MYFFSCFHSTKRKISSKGETHFRSTIHKPDHKFLARLQNITHLIIFRMSSTSRLKVIICIRMSRWKSATWCLITNIRIKFTFINFLPRWLHFTYYWRQLPGISLHSHGPYEFMASSSAVPQQIPSREPIENIKSISQWHLKYLRGAARIVCATDLRVGLAWNCFWNNRTCV